LAKGCRLLQKLVQTCVAMLALGLAAPVLAQTPPKPIHLGDAVRGELTDTSPRQPDGTPYQAYVFTGKKGQSVAIGMKASTFDSFLILRRQGEDHDLASDDDSGGGRDALLRFVLPADGTYEIRANAVATDGRGVYSLSFAERADVAEDAGLPDAIPLKMGQTLTGTLTDKSPLHEDRTPYQSYRFRGEKGQRVQVDMKSKAFDAYLVVRRAGSNIDVVQNDDSGGGSDARIVYTLPATGDYEIRANSVSSEARGAFTVSLSPGQPRPPVNVHQIALGQAVRGELHLGGSVNTDETLFDAWRFKGAAHQRVIITVLSNDFDALVSIHKPGVDAPLAFDDDSAGGTDPELSFMLPETGEYEIRVNTLGTDEKGKYILALSPRTE
jgi:hypothetical protein